ncbi:MAG: nitrite reductase, copper-containing [Chloroflexi bacterium]|nr:nitrite reductase, copper-containing [Chloroflexota bacterium]MBI4505779.1 nitrite reductase, copper-containing [Chloroflexota bacterium]
MSAPGTRAWRLVGAGLLVAALATGACVTLEQPTSRQGTGEAPAAQAAAPKPAAQAPSAQAGPVTTEKQPVQPAQPAQPAKPAAPQVEPAKLAEAVEIARSPVEIPAAAKRAQAQEITIELETQEVVGKPADGVTFTYWTYGGQVPGPFYRVRVGDTVHFTLKNSAQSKNPHSIDLHAVTGQGGGAALTQIGPGQSKTFTFKTLNPGLYVYHCATPLIPQHIANGMYGLILVEPEEGLPAVDREFYVMQGDLYTTGSFGQQGHHGSSVPKLTLEQPDYVVFNGRVGALTDKLAMQAKVGETVRIYFGVGGPNLTSAFHVIGEIFDRVYPEGAVGSPPMTNVQTTLVPPGGATIVEFKVDVPGNMILVDHALTRLTKGGAAILKVEGAPQPAIYREGR